MFGPLALIALLLVVFPANAAPSPSLTGSTLNRRYTLPDCFPNVRGADLPHAFDAGQTPATNDLDCAVKAWQARKPGAVWRLDHKICYFKTFPRNGAKTYLLSDRPVGAFDVPGYDVGSYKTRQEMTKADCTVYVENAGRFWCKSFPPCDKARCMLILPRLDEVGCDRRQGPRWP